MPLARDVDAKLLRSWAQSLQIENEVEHLSHLHKPLLEDEKVPVSQSTLDRWVGNATNVSMKLDSDDLPAIWRVGSDFSSA